MTNSTHRPAYTVSPMGYQDEADGRELIVDYDIQSSAGKEAVHQHANRTHQDNFYQDPETSEIYYDNSASEVDYANLLDSVGGEEVYSQMVEWAANNLSLEDIEAYDEVMHGGDLNMTYDYIQQLAERYYNRNEQVEIETDEVAEYVFNNVIGKEDYAQLADYVRANYDGDTIDQINAVMDSGNVEYIRNTIRSIQSNMGYN